MSLTKNIGNAVVDVYAAQLNALLSLQEFSEVLDEAFKQADQKRTHEKFVREIPRAREGLKYTEKLLKQMGEEMRRAGERLLVLANRVGVEYGE